MSRAKRYLKYLCMISLTAVFAAIAYVVYIDFTPSRGIKPEMWLNIEKLPDSVEIIGCESWGFSDVLAACQIELSPDDFDKLLKGWPHSSSPARGSTFTGSRPDVGERFDYSTVYNLQLDRKLAPYGGYLHIETDEERKKALIEIYIE